MKFAFVNDNATHLVLANGNCAAGAIKQIKDKQYVKALEGFRGEILLVGINYSKKSHEYTCLIERMLYAGYT